MMRNTTAPQKESAITEERSRLKFSLAERTVAWLMALLMLLSGINLPVLAEGLDGGLGEPLPEGPAEEIDPPERGGALPC